MYLFSFQLFTAYTHTAQAEHVALYPVPAPFLCQWAAAPRLAPKLRRATPPVSPFLRVNFFSFFFSIPRHTQHTAQAEHVEL